jgi:hypothetical protein
MRVYGCVLLGAAILCVPIYLSGHALLYFDSAQYISRGALIVAALLPSSDRAAEAVAGAATAAEPPPTELLAAEPPATGQNRPLIGGRSVYYGLVAYAALLLGDLRTLAVFQAVLTASVLAVLVFRVLGWQSVLGYLALLAGLCLLTPLGLFTGLVMPDFLAALLVLAVAMLMTNWHRFTRSERALLIGVSLFAAVSHQGHVLLAAGLLAVGTAAALLPRMRGRIARPALMTLAGIVGLALAAEGAFSIAVRLKMGEAPITRPHLTAHLVDAGPGVRYLNEHCPEAGFVLCDYRDRLPMEWRAFLFRPGPESGVFSAFGPEVQRGLAAEQARFVLAVVVHDPLGVAALALAASLRQLVLFDVSGVVIGPDHGERSLQLIRATDLIERIHAQPQRDQTEMTEQVSLTSYGTALLSLLMLAAASLALRRRKLTEPFGRTALLVALLGAGLLLNAVIFGVLASPYPRFQARVIWLLPLAALIVVDLVRRLPRTESGLSGSVSLRAPDKTVRTG